jgi:type IV pilus biogenesis protein CpaD/CtpE
LISRLKPFAQIAIDQDQAFSGLDLTEVKALPFDRALAQKIVLTTDKQIEAAVASTLKKSERYALKNLLQRWQKLRDYYEMELARSTEKGTAERLQQHEAEAQRW